MLFMRKQLLKKALQVIKKERNPVLSKEKAQEHKIPRLRSHSPKEQLLSLIQDLLQHTLLSGEPQEVYQPQSVLHLHQVSVLLQVRELREQLDLVLVRNLQN
jgi:hypothetical protein